MPTPVNAVMAFVAVAGTMMQASSAKKSARQQQQLAIMHAQGGLASAQATVGHTYEYAEKVMEIAEKQRELNYNQAAFTEAQGEYDQLRGENLHDLYDDQANTARAIGQRAAIAEDTQTRQLASSGMALTAAGGLVGEDTSRIIAEIEADGQYNSLVRLWEGDDAAVGLEYKGDIAKHEGEVANIVARYNAAVSLVQADIQYDESGLIADNAIHNANMAVMNAQSELNALTGGGNQRAGQAAKATTPTKPQKVSQGGGV